MRRENMPSKEKIWILKVFMIFSDEVINVHMLMQNFLVLTEEEFSEHTLRDIHENNVNPLLVHF